MLFSVLIILVLIVLRAFAKRVELRNKSKNAKIFGDRLEIIVVSYSLVFLVVKPVLVQPYSIQSTSMSPNMRPGDRVLVNKAAYWMVDPRRGDIVAFRPPPMALKLEPQLDGQELVKRVVGIEGDVVEVHAGKILVNNKPQTTYAPIGIDYDLAPSVVPSGQLFVLGDNQERSSDSHQWGPIEENLVVGRVTGIVWPPNRVGPVP